MKIISGKYKGRILKGFDINGTRPTMNRIKESLFGMIQDFIKDSVVLDLYAGSGNLAIEALSNGAKKAYLVDNNKVAIKTIKENLSNLKIENALVTKVDASYFLEKEIENKTKYDLIFLDPPYNTSELEKILDIINRNLDILNNAGIIVCETSKDMYFDKYDNLFIYKKRNYKDKNIFILKCKVK